IFRSGYRIETLTGGLRGTARILNTWIYAFFCLAALAFFTKTTGAASRGWLALFFVIGGISVVAGIKVIEACVTRLASMGALAARRIIVVGRDEDVKRFITMRASPKSGIAVAASAIFPDTEHEGQVAPDVVETLVRDAVQRARNLDIKDVIILAQDGQTHTSLARMADRFLDLPVAVHLARTSLTEQFPHISIGQLGSMRTLTLRPAPLSTFQLGMKRALDLIAATFGLVLLVPLFLIVAVLIKLDSKGPVFFRQRRLGYNQREFAIWKFRTMSTMDDGDVVMQAQKNDPRVTRIGRVLRRYNIDELPQLLNILLGQMSLVGPRPHAVAHDRHYEQIIKSYPRRLNVKPGITGWAQVNGYRGLTDTPRAMRTRITHDLFYIDNWSLAFDLYIIALTLVSPKAFRNAN
ncbi:MAG: exopolysaccharide biosynthesis polyprenyl glycosylphosphotransferase, partial [Hyphomicrobiaceae bacterium]